MSRTVRYSWSPPSRTCRYIRRPATPDSYRSPHATEAQDWIDPTKVIPVDVYTPAEAHAYLGERLANYPQPTPDDDPNDLAKDLGWLPLALAQSTAYLINNPMTKICSSAMIHQIG